MIGANLAFSYYGIRSSQQLNVAKYHFTIIVTIDWTIDASEVNIWDVSQLNPTKLQGITFLLYFCGEQ